MKLIIYRKKLHLDQPFHMLPLSKILPPRCRWPLNLRQSVIVLLRICQVPGALLILNLGKSYVEEQCKDVGIYSTCLGCAFPLGTFVQKVSQILCDFGFIQVVFSWCPYFVYSKPMIFARRVFTPIHNNLSTIVRAYL